MDIASDDYFSFILLYFLSSNVNVRLPEAMDFKRSAVGNVSYRARLGWSFYSKFKIHLNLE